MIHISPRSVVLKQDEQEHLLFIPAATPVFEDVQIHARVSLFRNNDNNNNTSYGIRRTDPFPELAETFWNEIIDYDSKNDRYVDCQESTIRRDIDRVIEVKDDDGCVPESLLFPID